MSARPLEDLIAELESESKKSKKRKRPKRLTEEQEKQRKDNLRKLIELKQRINTAELNSTNMEHFDYDRKYIGKLINRFQRKEWYYFPVYKKEVLNKIWKRYK